MSTKLTSLTAEQKALIPKYRDEQIAIGSSIEVADWETAERVVLRMLEISDTHLSSDHRIERARSPIAATLRGNKIAGESNTLFQSPSYGGSSARNNFFVEACGVTLSPELEEKRNLLTSFVASCGGAYLSSKVTIVYDRPAVISLTKLGDRHILHAEEGPALAWGRDEEGNYSTEDPEHYALFYWQGTNIPPSWITDKPTTQEEMAARAAEVLGTSNQEVLRAGCEILGWVPVLEALGMKVLDENPNPALGKLVTVDLPEAPNSKFLIAQCGTGRTVAVPADPDARTALEAGARSYGIPVSLYKNLRHRT